MGGPLKRRFSDSTQMMSGSKMKPTVIGSAQSFGGWMPAKMMTAMAMIESTQTRRNSGPPRFHGPGAGNFEVPYVNRASVIGTVNERNRKMTVHETTIE